MSKYRVCRMAIRSMKRNKEGRTMAMAESFCVSLLGKAVLSEVSKLWEENSRHRGQQVQRPRG